VLQNRLLRRIFGSRRDEVTRGWRKLHHEELHNFYSLDNIIRVVKSRRKGWALHIGRTDRDKRNVYNILVKTLKGRDHL
jgi:hypothetical protein